MINFEKEQKLLDSVVDTYVTSSSPQDRMISKLGYKTLSKFIEDGPNKTALELGCSDGFVTSLIAEDVGEVDVIDGSKRFLEEARERIQRANFIYGFFEDFILPAKYDYIFAMYILEHVDDVGVVLDNVKKHLKDDGKLFVIVPNARALSRQLARKMGIIDDLFSLTENDTKHGHRRVYDRTFLNRDIEANGFSIISEGGILLKPFADFQLDELIKCGVLGEEQISGLYALGLEYPDFCASLFAVCRKI